MYKILVLDNYDSFTYNLVHLIEELGFGENMDVIRNDKISVEDVAVYDKILLSPGPGVPDEAGITKEVIQKYASSKSIFGVCLGHQSIAEVFGGELYNMPTVLHGVDTEVNIVKKDEKLFLDIPEIVKVCRYHSWAVRQDKVGEELEVTAVDRNGEIMAICHKKYDVRGVQFHPESILTPEGKQMMLNWLTK